MTEKLFYQDSHRSTFTAIVQEVRPSGNGYEIILDRTAFFSRKAVGKAQIPEVSEVFQ